MHKDSWEVMRNGDTEWALRQMRANLEEDWSTSSVMELGVGYLWLGQYEDALDVFNSFNLRNPLHADCTYDMAGAVKWCLSSPEDAVTQWRKGLECEYKDTAGLGVGTPLLLYFAAMLQPDLVTLVEVEEILERLTEDYRIGEWPGPIVRFLLGEMDEEELRAACYDQNCARESILQHWQSSFYVGVQECAAGNISRYRELMTATGETSWEEFDQNEIVFLGKMWSPEFFIARYEAGLH